MEKDFQNVPLIALLLFRAECVDKKKRKEKAILEYKCLAWK